MKEEAAQLAQVQSQLKYSFKVVYQNSQRKHGHHGPVNMYGLGQVLLFLRYLAWRPGSVDFGHLLQGIGKKVDYLYCLLDLCVVLLSVWMRNRARTRIKLELKRLGLLTAAQLPLLTVVPDDRGTLAAGFESSARA